MPTQRRLEQRSPARSDTELKARIRALGFELGFDAIGFSRATVAAAARQHLADWLAAGRHGGMDYMARHAALRGAPAELYPGAISVISARLNYWPAAAHAEQVLADADAAYVSRYALGRDYHKTLRQRLQRLAERLAAECGPFAFRAFVDSAPVMEVEFARTAGLGWRGKHTLLLTQQGSWHFLGEIYTDLALGDDAAAPAEAGQTAAAAGAADTTDAPHAANAAHAADAAYAADADTADTPETADFADRAEMPEPAQRARHRSTPVRDHCGSCTACLAVCPTRAIVAPYQVDARRCISYLTIEHFGAIPEEFRRPIGNRIYGCDDCQLACPWNRFATLGKEPDFAPRHGLDKATLIQLFAWSEADFNDRLAGSPIRRIGHERWLRNIAVALGNAPPSPAIFAALATRADHPSPLVREHVAWALAGHRRTAT